MPQASLKLKNDRILTIKDIPAENAGLAHLEVDFLSLPDDQTRRFREFEDDLIDYLRLEGETISRRHLRFLRSALLNDSKYWIWEFKTPEDDKCYATVCIDGKSVICYGYDQDWDGLTPEQFLVADYFECL